MNINRATLSQASFYLVFAAVVATVVSIAVCHILIGLAFVTLVASRQRLRMPPIRLPLALFVAGTLLSCAFATDPAAGLPQIRKFYVLLTIPLVFTVFRDLKQVKRLVLACVAAATASALVGLVQFALKWKEASEIGAPFYVYYIGDRIIGFMSHWQTFGGHMMLAFILAAAFVLFARATRIDRVWWVGAASALSAAVVLGFTRNIWLGSAVGGVYLLWFWRRKLILLAPIALVLLISLGPDSLGERFTSFLQPHGEVDSNQHRIVTYRTGLRMIQAHPLLGLGPEHVGMHFEEYVPDDVPRPLPEGWYGHLHNIYLQYAAERGLPTLLCLLWLLGKMLLDFTRAAGRGIVPEGTWLLRAATASILAIMTSGFFEMNLGDTEVLTLLLAIVTGAYVIIDPARPEEKPEVSSA